LITDPFYLQRFESDAINISSHRIGDFIESRIAQLGPAPVKIGARSISEAVIDIEERDGAFIRYDRASFVPDVTLERDGSLASAKKSLIIGSRGDTFREQVAAR